MNGSVPEQNSVPARWIRNGPWRSRSVAIALLVTLVGVFSWISDARQGDGATLEDGVMTTTNSAAVSEPHGELKPDGPTFDWGKPLPVYARLSASYAVGCFAGWFFRRVSRLVLVASTIAIALLATGTFVGLDAEGARDEVRRGTQWTQTAIASARSSIQFAMPSATGFALGLFMGFRRRNR